MSAHTPGPWFTSRPHGTIYIEARLRGSTLQEVAAVGPTEAPEQQEANARLVAAAPELLEALQLLEAEMVLSGNAGSEDYGWKPAIEKTRAAIAKATGATP